MSIPPHQRVKDALIYAQKQDWHRAWVEGGGILLYIRKGHHNINGRVTECIDLANMTMTPKGGGRLRGLLDWLEQHLSQTGGVIFIENVLEPRLVPFLLRRGYVKQASHPDADFHSFYLQVVKS